MISDFHLIALELGSEEQMLERAVAALEPVEPTETVLFPEYLAWTPAGSGRAFAELLRQARQRDINIVTSLNVGPELLEDLPGRDADARYHALTLFTRHGAVHTPQAKAAPHAFEMDTSTNGPGIGIAPYGRVNRVRLDWQDTLLDVRFLIGSDLMAFAQLQPSELRCDLLIVIGNFAHGAEVAASRLLGRALSAGVAKTALHINAYDVPRDPHTPPLALKVEDVLDATALRAAPDQWPNARAIRSGFHVYEDDAAHDFAAVCALPRQGRIAVPRSRWKAKLTTGEYPVTVNF